jgi:hypothetical protein
MGASGVGRGDDFGDLVQMNADVYQIQSYAKTVMKANRKA